MRTREWLAARQPRPPAALASRIRDLLPDAPADAALPETLVAAADAALRELLRRPARDRAVALDLLAADALATYAFEAAADEPETIERRATEAIRGLSTDRVAP